MGTTEPVMGEPSAREPSCCRTRSSSRSALEVDTFRSPHPMQWAWYVEGGLDKARPGHHVEIEGDVELGEGIAILHTPGHTDGNQSLCINTPSGVWVSSENGVAIDNWQPELSKIPGVKQGGRVLRPRGGPQLEHARGLDRPVRLDGQGEDDRQPQPARSALPERASLVGDPALEAARGRSGRRTSTAASRRTATCRPSAETKVPAATYARALRADRARSGRDRSEPGARTRRR